jgi:hypothetical protein
MACAAIASEDSLKRIVFEILSTDGERSQDINAGTKEGTIFCVDSDDNLNQPIRVGSVI